MSDPSTLMTPYNPELTRAMIAFTDSKCAERLCNRLCREITAMHDMSNSGRRREELMHIYRWLQDICDEPDDLKSMSGPELMRPFVKPAKPTLSRDPLTEQGWIPMSAAPRDGELVDLRLPNGDIQAGRWPDNDGWVLVRDKRPIVYSDDDLTGWKPR